GRGRIRDRPRHVLGRLGSLSQTCECGPGSGRDPGLPVCLSPQGRWVFAGNRALPQPSARAPPDVERGAVEQGGKNRPLERPGRLPETPGGIGQRQPGLAGPSGSVALPGGRRPVVDCRKIARARLGCETLIPLRQPGVEVPGGQGRPPNEGMTGSHAITTDGAHLRAILCQLFIDDLAAPSYDEVINEGGGGSSFPYLFHFL